MSKAENNLLTAIDVGSAKTCVLVAEMSDAGPRYLAHGICESRGSRKGVIIDLEKAISSVQQAVEKAENAVGAPIEHAVVGVAGSHIRGITSQGGIVMGSRAREVTRDDIRLSVERARSINLPQDRQILHLLPQEFILDDQPGLHDPAGMIGNKLEVKVHVVTASTAATQNVVSTLNRAGIHVDDTVFEALVCADAVLRQDERELGVCLVDIGAGSSDLIVFHEGAVIHTGVVPVGGDHFTNDVSVGLRTPLADAEKVKRMFGCAIVTRIPESTEIEVTSVGDRPSRLMPQRLLGEIIEPRARELFEIMREHLRQAGMMDLIPAGIVLTGGGSKLNHIAEIAEDVLRKPIRLGLPASLSKMPSELAEPEYATAIGILLYAYKARMLQSQQDTGLGSKLKKLFARTGS
ncbi:MAG TPA: cell division protein FtsA [Terriglobales bacterium]|nr:cell division protein FtsA [Terriglobales bacterium]